MSRLKTYLILFITAAAVYGCKRQDIGEYENDPGLYFFRGTVIDKSHTSDSLTYSFFFAPDDYTRDTVYIDLRAMGLRSAQARPFTMIQIDTALAYAKAEPGIHFIPFDSPEIKDLWWMPANSVQFFMPVILLRDQSLGQTKVELKLAVGENSYFKQGVNRQTTFRIIFTSKIEQPTKWSQWSAAFGDWGERKMWFIINYLGITDFDDYSTDDTYKIYLKSVAQKQLAKYNAVNPTLVEADGTPVTF